jgi:hypothetical protein
VVDSATGKTLHTLAGDKYLVMGAAFSPDGSKLFSANGFDAQVVMWDVTTGKALRILESHTKFVDHLAVSPDGRWLASWAVANNADGDHDCRIWEVATGKLVQRLSPMHGGERDRMNSALFSADSRRLVAAVSDGNSVSNIEVWDVINGQRLRNFTSPFGWTNAVGKTADDRMIVTIGEDNTLRLWELASGTERGKIEGHRSEIWGVDFSRNGRYLAATSFDAPIYIWDSYAVHKSAYPADLAKADQDQLWRLLAAMDAAKAFRAICELIARPAEAVPIIEKGWRSIPRVTAQQIKKWIEDLDSPQFSVRDKAGAELQIHGFMHEALLRQARDKASSLELRRRLDQILDRQDPEKLRRTRMLEVLERVGTGEVRRLLQSLAEQTEDAELSREASAGLNRL